MRIRTLKKSDIPALREFAVNSGFPYPPLDHPHIEAILVVVDSDDRPLMACAAKRLIELYLYVDGDCSTAVKMAALRALHPGMAESLRALGYDSVDAFISPQLSGKFGRRLERTFGWVRNWPSFCKRF